MRNPQAAYRAGRRESGIYQANRILERIRAIYNKGIEWAGMVGIQRWV